MGQTVYVDIFFLINFSMDFLCFFLTSKILSRRMPLARGILGAVMGGIYADAALFLSLGKLASLTLDIAVCSAMCAVVFGERKRLRDLPLYILVYTAVSMALGGFMTAFFNLLNRSALFDEGLPREGDGISVWAFALLALISAGITLISGRFFMGRASQKNAEVEVRYEGKSLRLHAMTDNGNFLREPVSGRPCIVADISALEKVLPYEIVRAAKSGNPSAVAGISVRHVKNIRLVPTHTAAGEGILLALRMERITVDSGRGAREVDAFLALADLGGTAGQNEALLPAQLTV